MTGKSVAQFLIEHGKCTESGGVLAVPDGLSATLYVSMGSEPMIVDKLSTVAVKDDTVVAETSRGDVFVVLAQDIRALRFGGNRGRTGLV